MGLLSVNQVQDFQFEAPPLRLETALAESRPYFLGHRSLSDISTLLLSYSFDQLFLITDDHVHALHGKNLCNHLRARGLSVQTLILPAGESCKTFSVLESTCEQLVRDGASKDSIILALGGGAVGNLAGLAASLLFRGVRFAQIPTTFMAQTDSTLSNKQAVNGNSGKNLFGTFYPPLFIWTDTVLLLTEDTGSLTTAVVETVKNAFIADPSLLDYLDNILDSAMAKNPAALHDLVRRSILSKQHILQSDPTEKRAAMALEYGHTFGHALEKLAAGELTHGHAVAIGMMLAAKVSRRLGMLDDNAVELHHYFLAERLGLPLEIPARISTPQILTAIASDNKRSRLGVRYVLLESLGKPFNRHTDCLAAVDETVIHDVLEDFRRQPARANAPTINPNVYTSSSPLSYSGE